MEIVLKFHSTGAKLTLHAKRHLKGRRAMLADQTLYENTYINTTYTNASTAGLRHVFLHCAIHWSKHFLRRLSAYPHILVHTSSTTS
jgi:hypothetical protein